MESDGKSVYLVLYLSEYVEEFRVCLQRYMDGWESVKHFVCAMTVVFCQSGNGDIDTISIDLTGDGEFNLYLHDADGNGIPDSVLYADDASDQMEVLAIGSEVEQRLKDVAAHLIGLLSSDDFDSSEVTFSLNELAEYLKKDLAELIAEVQAIVNPSGIERIYRFLNDAGVYYLATVEGDQPRVRAFGTALLYDGRLYIQTGKVKSVSRQIAANPKVEICAFKDGAWMRLAGILENDDSIEVKQAMLDKNPSLKSMYSADDNNTQVLYFKEGSATFCSFTSEPEVVDF